MSSWYAMNLIHTVINLIISVKLFLGRFDARTMRSALVEQRDKVPEPSRPFEGQNELWFDFVADTGDGFNSTYAIARSLAQPNLTVNVPDRKLFRRIRVRMGRILSSAREMTVDGTGFNNLKMRASDMLTRMGKRRSDSDGDESPKPMQKAASYESFITARAPDVNEVAQIELPRGKLLLHGGDLAYPHPSLSTYEERLFRPYEAALAPPTGANTVEVASKEQSASSNLAQQHSCPQCWMIPGNHDWFDGLETFLHTICGRHWFGGWHLPQTNTYWALELPQNWFVLGFDLGLSDDVDDMQYSYFAAIVAKLPAHANVICITHGPHWYLDSYYKRETGPLQTGRMYKEILKMLGPTLRVLLAGDIHHYSRYSPKLESDNHDHERPELIVSGGGGAFMHPTHLNVPIAGYECKCLYPPPGTSLAYAFRNPLQFRRRNWAFEVLLGSITMCMVLPALPMCGDADTAFAALQDETSLAQSLTLLTGVVWKCYVRIFETTTLALLAHIGGMLFLITFAENQWGQLRRLLWGIPLALSVSISTVVWACFLELALLSLGIEGHQAKRGSQAEPPQILHYLAAPLDEIGVWAFRSALYLLDLPTHIYHARTAVCAAGAANATRSSYLLFYILFSPYFWIIATPVGVFLFGTYLGLASLGGRHMDEAFSSLRIEDYKNFLRMHIDQDGGLHIFAIGVDKVPRDWVEDPMCKSRYSLSRSPSESSTPSRWMPIFSKRRPAAVVKCKLVESKHLLARTKGDNKVKRKGQRGYAHTTFD